MLDWLGLEQCFRHLQQASSVSRLGMQQFEILCWFAGGRLGGVLVGANDEEKRLLALPDPEYRWRQALAMFGLLSEANKNPVTELSFGRFAQASADLCLRLQESHPRLRKPPIWRRIADGLICTALILAHLALIVFIVKWWCDV